MEKHSFVTPALGKIESLKVSKNFAIDKGKQKTCFQGNRKLETSCVTSPKEHFEFACKHFL